MVQLSLGPTPLQAPEAGSAVKLPAWTSSAVETGAALHVVKSGDTLTTLRLDKSVYSVFGRNPRCACNRGRNFVVDHPSISRQHAVIIHNKNGNLYLVDLGSTHGTFVSGERLEPFVPHLLDNRKVITFGLSTRCYLVRLFPTEDEIITHNRSPCYSAPLASKLQSPTLDEELSHCESDDDRTVVVHTGLNCFLSCVPQEEHIARRRSKTRGSSLDGEMMTSAATACSPNRDAASHVQGTTKTLGGRRVSFACSLAEIIPNSLSEVSNDRKRQSISLSTHSNCENNMKSAYKIARTSNTPCVAKPRHFQVAIDVNCANSTYDKSPYRRVQVVSTPKQRTPLTPIRSGCKRASLDMDVRVATPVE